MRATCRACGRTLEPGQEEFCTAMCRASAREVFGRGGAQYFGDDDERVSPRERSEARASLAHSEEAELERWEDPEDCGDDPDETLDSEHETTHVAEEVEENEDGVDVEDDDYSSFNFAPGAAGSSERIPDAAFVPRPPVALPRSLADLRHAPTPMRQETFGLFRGMSLEEGLSLGGKRAAEPGVLILTSPPFPHPQLPYYACAFDTFGLFRIIAFCESTRLTLEGSPLRQLYERLVALLSMKYGQPERVDELRHGSRLTQAINWRSSLHVGDRKVYCRWDNRVSRLPSDLEYITLGVHVITEVEGIVTLQYDFARQFDDLQDSRAEIAIL